MEVPLSLVKIASFISVLLCSGEKGEGAQFLGNTPWTAAEEGLNYLAASAYSQVKPKKTRETSWGSRMTPLDHQVGRKPLELARATQLKRAFPTIRGERGEFHGKP